MSRPPCFVANWKMNMGFAATQTYLVDLIKRCARGALAPSKIIIAPPFTALDSASNVLKEGASEIALAAQNVHFAPSGAYTGEVSTEMLCEIGCKYVIIGHSERRILFGESDEDIHQKLVAARKAGLLPILCIGETQQDRQAGKTWQRLRGQLNSVFSEEFIESSLSDTVSDWMVAYEPVWAIGTGETPEPADVAEVHRQIQTLIADNVGKGVPRVLYGGSISEKNIVDFMKTPGIDGVLVGGASLSPETFFEIIAQGASAKEGSAE